MKNYLTVILVPVLLLMFTIVICPVAAIAAGAVTSTVDAVRVDKDGRGFIILADDLEGTPAIPEGQGYNSCLSFDTSTEGGKAILSLALTAKATGKSVYAKGTGSISIYSAMEDCNYLIIQD